MAWSIRKLSLAPVGESVSWNVFLAFLFTLFIYLVWTGKYVWTCVPMYGCECMQRSEVNVFLCHSSSYFWDKVSLPLNLEFTTCKPSCLASSREPPVSDSISLALGLQAVPPCPDLYMGDGGRIHTQVLMLTQGKRFSSWAISSALVVFPFKPWLWLMEQVPALSGIFLWGPLM